MISFPKIVSNEVKDPIFLNLVRYSESNYILDIIDEKPAAHVLFYMTSSTNPEVDEKVLLSVIIERKIDPNPFISILYDLAVKINATPNLDRGVYYDESDSLMDSAIERYYILLRDIMASSLDQIRNQLQILKNPPLDMKVSDGWT